MLRITKTSPGVLDLSAVKDELGLPVILNGPSHRDVPDHEENNPVLQSVVTAQWVTVARLPVTAPEDDPATPSEPPEPSEPGAPETQPETSGSSLVEDDNPTGTTDHDDDGASQPPEDNGAVDVAVKPEEPSKPFSRSDARKAGRRS
jgi:hypothetical protein